MKKQDKRELADFAASIRRFPGLDTAADLPPVFPDLSAVLPEPEGTPPAADMGYVAGLPEEMARAADLPFFPSAHELPEPWVEAPPAPPPIPRDEGERPLDPSQLPDHRQHPWPQAPSFPDARGEMESLASGAGFPEAIDALPPEVAEFAPLPPQAVQDGGELPAFRQYQGPDGSTVFESEGAAVQAEPPDFPEARQDSAEGGDSVMSLLGQIRDSLAGLSGQRGPQPSGLPGGGWSQAGQLPWGGVDAPDVDQLDDYAPASVSVNVTSLNGARGAGGWGYGSRGMGSAATDRVEPGRRILTPGMEGFNYGD